MENMNTSTYVERVKNKIVENLRALQGAPSVQMQAVRPLTCARARVGRRRRAQTSRGRLARG